MYKKNSIRHGYLFWPAILCVVIMLISIIPMGAVQNAKAENSTSDVMGLWRLDEGIGTTAIDTSGNKNHGTIYGASWAADKSNSASRALQFDGSNDYVNVPNSSTLNPTVLTVEAWIKPSDFAAGSGMDWARVIVSKGSEAVPVANSYVLLTDAAHAVEFIVFIGSYRYQVGGGSLQINNWYHVVGTYDGSYIKVYVNGELKGTQSAGSPRSTNTNNVMIGRQYPTPSGYYNYYFNGVIDEVKIFNGALSLSEIETEYSLPATPTTTAADITVTATSVSNTSITKSISTKTTALSPEGILFSDDFSAGLDLNKWCVDTSINDQHANQYTTSTTGGQLHVSHADYTGYDITYEIKSNPCSIPTLTPNDKLILEADMKSIYNSYYGSTNFGLINVGSGEFYSVLTNLYVDRFYIGYTSGNTLVSLDTGVPITYGTNYHLKMTYKPNKISFYIYDMNQGQMVYSTENTITADSPPPSCRVMLKGAMSGYAPYYGNTYSKTDIWDNVCLTIIDPPSDEENAIAPGYSGDDVNITINDETTSPNNETLNLTESNTSTQSDNSTSNSSNNSLEPPIYTGFTSLSTPSYANQPTTRSKQPELIANAKAFTELNSNTADKNTDVVFSAYSSIGATSYSWNFGDGTTANGILSLHKFKEYGTYDVTLTAKNDNGGESTDTIRIYVEQPAVLVDLTPIKLTVEPGETAKISIPVKSIGTNTVNLQLTGISTGWYSAPPTLTIDGLSTIEINITIPQNLKLKQNTTYDLSVTVGNKPISGKLVAIATYESKIRAVIDEINKITPADKKQKENIEKASKELNKSLEVLTKEKENVYESSFEHVKEAIQKLNKANLPRVADFLIETIKLKTVEIIKEAELKVGSNNKDIVKAYEKYNKGIKFLNKEKTEEGIESFKEAVNEAEKSLEQIPTAVILVDKTTVYTGEIITFNASLSKSWKEDKWDCVEKDNDREDKEKDCDKEKHNEYRIINYTWNFGDGSTAYGAVTTHQYTENGVYIVVLTVKDAKGKICKETKKLHVVKGKICMNREGITVLNRAPSAIIETTTPTTQYTFEDFTFSGMGASDADGTIVNYLTDFGDGEYTISTSPQANHQYADDGIYTVTLVVLDNDGDIDTDTTTATVLNRAPTAVIAPSATTLYTYEAFTFDASQSSDRDGTIISYDWNLGDENTASSDTVTHEYTEDGIYTIKLTITDDDGAISTAEISITVLNRPPTALFTASATELYTFEIFNFDATQSYDRDGTIAKYEWNFGDDVTAEGSTTSHYYTNNGICIITLKVTDNDNAVATKALIVTVLNRAPIADAGSDRTLTKSMTALFDASNSYDIDGTIESYWWNFGDDATGEGETTSHTYARDGVYTVTLTIIDDDGATAQTIIHVTVAVPPIITNPTILPTSASVVAGDYITISMSATDIVGISKVEAYIQQPDGTTMPAKGLINVEGDKYEISFGTSDMSGLYHINIYAIDVQDNHITKDNLFAFFVTPLGVKKTVEGATAKEAPIITAGETITIDAKIETSTTLDITTTSTIEAVTITVVEYNTNLVGGVNAPEVNKIIGIKPTDNLDPVLSYAIIKIYYTDDEIAGMDESKLRPFVYDEVKERWDIPEECGVDTANNYVWLKTTHFSPQLFGLGELIYEVIEYIVEVVENVIQRTITLIKTITAAISYADYDIEITNGGTASDIYSFTIEIESAVGTWVAVLVDAEGKVLSYLTYDGMCKMMYTVAVAAKDAFYTYLRVAFISAANADEDGDGLINSVEGDMGTCLLNEDTDGDTLWDGYDVGTNKGELTERTLNVDGVIQRYTTDPLKYDTDGDRLWDGDEQFPTQINKDGITTSYSSNPTLRDTDGDMHTDYLEVKRGFDPTDVSKPLMAWAISEHPDDLRSTSYSTIVDLGALYLRTDFWWDQIEPTKDNFDPNAISKFRGIVENARASGIGIIAVLGANMPMWASNLYSLTYPELLAIEYKQYCAKIAEEFGDYIDYYQLFNEENHPAHSQIGIIHEPILFQAGYEGIASKDSYFKTIVNVFTNVLDWADHLKGWLDSSANPYINIIAIDHYPSTWTVTGADDWGPLDSLINLCNQYGKKGAIMETGFSTWGGEGAWWGTPGYTHTEDDQEIFINTALPIIKNKVRTQNTNNPSKKILLATWYELKDPKDAHNMLAPLEIQYNFGILRYNSDPKLGYTDLQNQIRTFTTPS